MNITTKKEGNTMKNERPLVIGKTKITFTNKGIQIQSPTVIIQGDVIQERKEN